ncbi:helix-turn-helix domain-containing protein [bacterium]|nr:helix-turn-helix domain-containing protein [bacterium]
MKRVAYLRISTAEQKPDRQIDGLRELADELHIETLSAVARKRPVYERAVRRLEPGDVLVVWALDRAYRSAKDALTELDKLRDRGVHFRIASLDLDTSTATGIFVYTIMSALAEFERRTLSQRTREGMAAARARGKRIGRPPKLSAEQLREVRTRLRMESQSITAIAAELHVSPWTLSRHLRQIGAASGES